MNKIATYVLLIVTCLVPVIVNPYSSEIFSQPKVLFVYFCCLIILMAIVKFKAFRKTNPLLSIQEKLISIYILLCIISTFFSVNVYNSLIGRTGRREGLFAIICYVILFFTASHFYEFNTKHLRYLAYASIPVSFFGILQFMGYDLVCGFTSQSLWYKQAFSTIGHRNFVGAYICLMLPLMTLSYIYLKDKLYFFTSCMLFLCLLSTTTRSAWLSLTLLFIFFFVLGIKKFLNIKPLLCLTIAFAVLFVLYNHINNNVFVGRYTSIYTNAVEFKDDSGSGRVFIWRHALPMVLDRPIFGTGIDNLGEVFMQKYAAEAQKQMPDTYVDKAHNEFLQIAVTTGIPALLIYVAFLIVMFIKSLKYLWNDKRVFVLFCCILTYQVQANLNISVTSVAPVMWILLGILNNMLLTNENIETEIISTCDEIISPQ